MRPVQDVFRFHHVLVRDVAYRGIPKAERAELHELAGKGLDRRDGADELVGYHFEQAYRYLTELQRDDEHAHELAAAGSERLGRAGIRAWKRADAPAAVNLLSRAVDLVPEAAELACELGLALRVVGDVTRAEDVLVGVSEATDERVRLRARIELAFLRSLTEPNRADELLDIASGAIPKLEAENDDRALGQSVGLHRARERCLLLPVRPTGRRLQGGRPSITAAQDGHLRRASVMWPALCITGPATSTAQSRDAKHSFSSMMVTVPAKRISWSGLGASRRCAGTFRRHASWSLRPASVTSNSGSIPTPTCGSAAPSRCSPGFLTLPKRR